jgi:hypothetical protein
MTIYRNHRSSSYKSFPAVEPIFFWDYAYCWCESRTRPQFIGSIVPKYYRKKPRTTNPRYPILSNQTKKGLTIWNQIPNSIKTFPIKMLFSNLSIFSLLALVPVFAVANTSAMKQSLLQVAEATM